MSDAAGGPVVKFKRKRQRRAKGQLRQKDSDTDDADDGLVGEIGASKTRRLASAKPTTTDSSLLIDRAVASTRSAAPQQGAGGVTATAETETEHDRDALAIRKRHIEEGATADEAGVYKGTGSYKSYVKRDMESATSGNKVSGAHGPIRAPAHIRNVSLFDYQRDICKDYKETGFCSFGDTCIYLHERADYKTGWQLEEEWKEKERKREARIMRGDDPDVETDEEKDEEELPFACLLCRKPFRHPVKTLCGHFFCETCALGHYQKTSLCFACKKPTGGVFNHSKQMEERMAKTTAAEEARPSAAPPAAVPADGAGWT